MGVSYKFMVTVSNDYKKLLQQKYVVSDEY